MSTLFGFIVGYVVGARAGSQGFERLEQAWREVRESEEFRSFVELVKSHAKGTLQQVNDRLQSGGPVFADLDDLADQARTRLRQALDEG